MSKLRFGTIIWLSLLLVFVYDCTQGSVENEAAKASAQEQEHGELAEREQGEH